MTAEPANFRTMPHPLLFALLAIAAPASAAPAAPVLGRQAFTLVLPVSPETEEGQRRIAARAVEICGARRPKLGRYQFRGARKIDPPGDVQTWEVRQEMECLSALPPPPPPVAAAHPAWRPGAADERQVRGLTERYFALVDRGTAAEVHGLWSAPNREATPLPQREAQLTEFRRKAGRPLRHRIAKLTWYVNPEGAPEPGIYVAADYERSYSGLALNCGYVVWLRQPGGGYALVREETGLLGRDDMSDDSPAKIAEARALLRCPAP